MNKNLSKNILFSIGGFLLGLLVMFVISNYKIEKKTSDNIPDRQEVNVLPNTEDSSSAEEKNQPSNEIDKLTSEDKVIAYVKTNRKLPDYYLTKGAARSKGWIAAKGNLCEVLPGRAIGGDKFSNREKTLPAGDQYFEADVNYNCGNRNADRIVFTRNGDVWLTHDHYKSFEKK